MRAAFIICLASWRQLVAVIGCHLPLGKGIDRGGCGLFRGGFAANDLLDRLLQNSAYLVVTWKIGMGASGIELFRKEYPIWIVTGQLLKGGVSGGDRFVNIIPGRIVIGRQKPFDKIQGGLLAIWIIGYQGQSPAMGDGYRDIVLILDRDGGIQSVV